MRLPSRSEGLDPARRIAALGGALGVSCFVGAWVVGGALRPGYDPVNTAISELAASGTDHRYLMTGGFVLFGAGVGMYSWALRSASYSPAWLAASIAALASFGVAAAPLGAHDTLHVVAAATGYVALAAMPLLAAPALRAAGLRRGAAASVTCGLLTAALLASSLLDPAHGATQRGGLLVADAWIVVTSLAMWRHGGFESTATRSATTADPPTATRRSPI